MKKLLAVLGYVLVLFLLCHLDVHAQVYVDIDATGTGDGSSWANAHTSIEAAVAGAAKGSSLWIAEGVYRPTETIILEEADLDLFGGFAGTEASLDQRDLSRESVISGDVNGDDSANSLTSASEDNLKHVLIIIESTTMTIDGLVIEGGRGALEGTFADIDATGGGLICNAEIAFHNCKVRNNVARFGAGIYLVNTAAIAGRYSFVDCEISGNEGNSFGGGIYAGFGGTMVSFDGCTFKENVGNRGAGVYFAGTSGVTEVTMTDCVFEENQALDIGGGFSMEGMARGSAMGCSFIKNKAIRGAGCTFFKTTATLENCMWQENRAEEEPNDPGLGGAIYIENDCDITLINSSLMNNIGESSGGGILMIDTEGTSNMLDIQGCTFFSNRTPDRGGAIYSQDNASITIDQSTFDRNNGGEEGGAIYIRNDVDLEAKNTLFTGNKSTNDDGGAIYSTGADPGVSLRILQCEFLENEAEEGGGAVTNFGREILIEDCLFQGNSTDDWGGALHQEGQADANPAIINRCQFISNRSVNSAGAIYHEDGFLTVSNSLFYDNVAEGDGIGNAMSTNTFDATNEPVFLINNTFHEDAPGLGAVTPWAADSEGRVHNIDVQNCIFSGEGNPWMIESGMISQSSRGGNLLEKSVAGLFTDPTDVSNTDPMFVDPDNGDFNLMAGSPAINSGVTMDAPSDDITGATRDGMPDRGAYEFGAVTSLTDVEKLDGDLVILGNPVGQYLMVDWRGESLAEVDLSVISTTGQVLMTRTLDRWSSVLTLSVAALPSGSYWLVLHNRQGIATAKFLKR